MVKDAAGNVVFEIRFDGKEKRKKDNEEFESLSRDECVLSEASTIDLLNELNRRGINVCITINGKETV